MVAEATAALAAAATAGTVGALAGEKAYEPQAKRSRVEPLVQSEQPQSEQPQLSLLNQDQLAQAPLTMSNLQGYQSSLQGVMHGAQLYVSSIGEAVQAATDGSGGGGGGDGGSNGSTISDSSEYASVADAGDGRGQLGDDIMDESP